MPIRRGADEPGRGQTGVVGGCCDPSGYDQVFGDGFARRAAKRYRRRGLDATATRMVDFLAEDGLEGATVLEIGGGIGEIGVELVRRGAAEVTTLELSSAYDDEARRVAREADVAGRVHRRIADIATNPDSVDSADLVVLHRVVCCYPDHRRLLTAVADATRRLLVLSYPLPRMPVRTVLGTQNLVHRRLGQEFRVYARPPATLFATLAERGLRVLPPSGGLVWQVAAAVRD